MKSRKELVKYFNSKEVKKFLKEHKEHYSDIVTTYISLCVTLENIIENFIATFYFFNNKNKENLIEYLIVDITFNKKIQILKSLINQSKFKHLYSKELKLTFDKTEKIIRKRNRVVHASVYTDFKNLKWDSSKRIILENRAHSFNQKLFMTKKESNEDFSICLDIIGQLFNTENTIEEILYKEQVAARKLRQAISKKRK